MTAAEKALGQQLLGDGNLRALFDRSDQLERGVRFREQSNMDVGFRETHAASFIFGVPRRHSGSACNTPADSTSSCNCRNAGGRSPHPATDGWLMPSFAASATCVPPAHLSASSVVMTDSIAAAILPVNRPGYSATPDHPSTMETMGQRVRGLRKTMGLTQVQLARQVGVSQSAISDIESGDTKVILGPTMTALCIALRTNPEWLQHGRGSPAPAVTTDIEEGELLTIFRVLPAEMRAALMTTARSMQAASAAGPTAVNPFPAKTRKPAGSRSD